MSRPISDRKAWIAHENIVVALVLDNAGQDDSPVAITLRETGELNEVLVLFLNTLIILSHASHFFSILATLDFDNDANKLVDWDEKSGLVKVSVDESLEFEAIEESSDETLISS